MAEVAPAHHVCPRIFLLFPATPDGRQHLQLKHPLSLLALSISRCSYPLRNRLALQPYISKRFRNSHCAQPQPTKRSHSTYGIVAMRERGFKAIHQYCEVSRGVGNISDETWLIAD